MLFPAIQHPGSYRTVGRTGHKPFITWIDGRAEIDNKVKAVRIASGQMSAIFVGLLTARLTGHAKTSDPIKTRREPVGISSRPRGEAKRAYQTGQQSSFLDVGKAHGLFIFVNETPSRRAWYVSISSMCVFWGTKRSVDLSGAGGGKECWLGLESPSSPLSPTERDGAGVQR